MAKGGCTPCTRSPTSGKAVCSLSACAAARHNAFVFAIDIFGRFCFAVASRRPQGKIEFYTVLTKVLCEFRPLSLPRSFRATLPRHNSVYTAFRYNSGRARDSVHTPGAGFY
jgi:hypothetical protein